VSDKIVHTTDGNFDADVTNNEKAVLIDFWAEWCGPCKMIAPLLDEVADEYADKLAIVKLNVDENPNTAQKFGIRSIPTLILFKDGAVQAQKLGAMSKSQLAEFIDTDGEISSIDVAAPGFINFTLAPKWLQAQVDQVLSAGDAFGSTEAGKGQKIQVALSDYCQLSAPDSPTRLG
jgi:thioredoxin 1